LSNNHDPATIDLLARLVEFDSSNETGNCALIDFVADYLQSIDIESQVVSDPVLQQKNLLAQLGGQGESGGIVLVGHSDVVSATEVGWLSDPFSLRDDGENVIGRGVCDMKGFLASVLALAPQIATRNLARPIHLGMTFNGEADLLGAKRLAQQIKQQNIEPRAVILGKPSAMQINTQHKGLTRIITEVHTPGGHSATHNRSVSALWIAANLIEYLNRLENESRQMPDAQFKNKSNWTTINVGSIFGGSRSNTVASRCTFEWEISDVPGFSANEVLRQFTRYCEATVRELTTDDTEIKVESAREYCADPIASTNRELDLQFVFEALENDNTGAAPNHTEATVYHQAGLPVLVCGPGDIGDSHKANETLSKKQLSQCDRFIARLVDQFDTLSPEDADNLAA